MHQSPYSMWQKLKTPPHDDDWLPTDYDSLTTQGLCIEKKHAFIDDAIYWWDFWISSIQRNATIARLRYRLAYKSALGLACTHDKTRWKGRVKKLSSICHLYKTWNSLSTKSSWEKSGFTTPSKGKLGHWPSTSFPIMQSFQLTLKSFWGGELTELAFIINMPKKVCL